MEHKQSELAVITKAKDLCSYVMTVTQKSPKQFRFTFTSRLQNLSLDVIEALYRANDTFVTKENVSAREKRLEFQHQAMTNLKLLAYFSLLAREQNCILPKQYEQIRQILLLLRRLLTEGIERENWQELHLPKQERQRPQRPEGSL